MEKLIQLSARDKKVYRLIIVVFVLLCLLIGFLCFRYYLKLQDTVKTESQGYMLEISKQMSSNIRKNIIDKYSILDSISTTIDDLDINSYESLQKITDKQQRLWDYQKLLLIDKNGTTYDEKGNVLALGTGEYLQDIIIDKRPSISTSQVIEGKDCIVFATPIENLIIDGTPILGLAVSYDLNNFDKILDMTAFSGQGYAHIIHNDGSTVIRSSSENALETGYNVLNSLSTAEFTDDITIDDVKNDIAQSKVGQAEFTLGDNHEYMIYMPLNDLQWSLLSFVPVETVNEKSNMLLNITLLMCGFITLTFAVLLLTLILTFYRNKSKLEKIAYVDKVTGGNTIERFYEIAQSSLQSSGDLQYALVYTNIEKFKVLNEQFGRRACDEILCSMEQGISLTLSSDECMGRLFADNFCILIRYEGEEALSQRFELWNKNRAAYLESTGTDWLPLILEFGIYVIDNCFMGFPQMIDRAKLSLNEATGKLQGKIRYAIYDERVRSRLFREKQLEDKMEESMEKREFQVYLQPKYYTQSEEIGGAEALVRWKSSFDGMIFPDEFISLFEKNGFIIQLDFYMFEEVCKTIRKWIDTGLTPIKVSVNCSRLHLKNADFLKQYITISNKYNLPRKYIEIELTENTVFENVEKLSDIINEIRSAGFGCSMDDFGSGYSSLNLIQDIPVDTLKLDKIFFSNTKDLQRSESVLRSIITMSKALSMKTVAEGVEVRSQVDMLKRLDCDYIQGYFFAKPMPVVDFEKLAYGSVISVPGVEVVSASVIES